MLSMIFGIIGLFIFIFVAFFVAGLGFIASLGVADLWSKKQEEKKFEKRRQQVTSQLPRDLWD